MADPAALLDLARRVEALTESEALALEHLDSVMEALAIQVGMYIVRNRKRIAGSHYSSVGGSVCGRLYKRGLVTYLFDLNAWRITPAGRAALRARDAAEGGERADTA
jgi:hypothetical protein